MAALPLSSSSSTATADRLVYGALLTSVAAALAIGTHYE